MPTLFGVLEKRDWAEHHLQLIESSINAFFDSDPYPFLTERDPKRGFYQARLVHPQPFPRNIALMIGDCVHNMRSSLDFIAWELAGASISDTETMFPIFETDSGFKQRGMRRIKHLPPKAQTLVERLQPYNRRYGGHLLALSAINKIDAADKHKLVSITTALANEANCLQGVPAYAKRGKYITNINLFTKRLEHDAVIATYIISPPLPEMEVQFKLSFQVEFSDIYGFEKHAFVIPNLNKMLDSLDLVIKRFRPFF